MKKSLLALAAMLCMGVASATPPSQNNSDTNNTAVAGAAAGAVSTSGAAAGAAVTGSGNSNATGGAVVGSGNSNNDNRSSATGGNATGGTATNTNNIGTASGFNSRSLSPEANANSTNLNTNANTSVNTNTAAQGQQQGQLQGQQQGQQQGQAILGSGNSTNVLGQSTNAGNNNGNLSNTGNSTNTVTSTNTIADGAVRNTNSNTIAEGAVQNSVSTGSQTVTTTGTVGNVAGGSSTATVAEGAVQNSVTNGSATSGNTQSITVNTYDPNAADAARAAGDADITVAQINAAAAKEVAGIQAAAMADAARQKIRNTPSVNGPPLTSSNDTCMGSASGSLNVPGLGIGVGKTYTDTNCVRLKNSRELWNMGMKAAAMELMCMDDDNRAALESTGYVCKLDRKGEKVEASKAN